MFLKAIVALAAAACLAGYVFVYATGRADLPVRSDGFSYYVYLPSWFIFHDPSLAATARDCCGGEFPDYAAINRWPGTRRWVNAHPIGVAVLQLPFFIAAHGLTLWTNLSPDGFSFYYQHGAGLAGLTAVIAGLIVLARLLRRHFSERITAATLLALLFGTNLYHYATFDSSFSHPYSFFLFAAFLYLTERWQEKATTRRSLLVGLVAALIVLVRHTNALFWIVLPLYGVRNWATLRAAIAGLWRNRSQLAIAAAMAAIAMAPQLAIYYQSTGRFFVSSYGELGFNFTEPRLWGVLFSPQKGVFFWAPLLLLAAAGLALARDGVRAFLVPASIVLVIHTYLIASWWDWQFGGSYGHRGFVDVLPLLALGLASMFEAAVRRRWTRYAATAVCLALVALSTFQMLQYWYGIVPFNDMTWTQYRGLFLRWR